MRVLSTIYYCSTLKENNAAAALFYQSLLEHTANDLFEVADAADQLGIVSSQAFFPYSNMGYPVLRALEQAGKVSHAEALKQLRTYSTDYQF